MDVINETVSVWTTETGVPSRFVWRGRGFTVMKQPIPWISREKWCRQAIRKLFSRKTSITLEQQMWGVQVMSETDGQILLLDLAVADASGPWRVAYIYD